MNRPSNFILKIALIAVSFRLYMKNTSIYTIGGVLAALSLAALEAKPTTPEKTKTAPAPAAAPAAPAEGEAAPAPAAKVDPKVAGYYFGYSYGSQLTQMAPGIKLSDLNEQSMLEGFKAALSGKEPSLKEEQIRPALEALQGALQKRMSEVAESNLKKGQDFLKENAKAEGVKTLEGGVQYKVVTEGKGPTLSTLKEEDKAGAGAKFEILYKGETLDGKVFDETRDGKAIDMPFNRTIPGFQEIFKIMPVGSKWIVWIPADKAYGEQSPTPAIPPNSVLKFELELKGIKPADKEPEGGAGGLQITPEQLQQMLEAQGQGGGAKPAPAGDKQ